MKIIHFVRHYGIYSITRGLKAVFRNFGIIKETYYLMENNIVREDIAFKMNNYEYSDVSELRLDDFRNSDLISKNTLDLFKTRFQSEAYSCFGIKSNAKVVYYTWISWKHMGYLVMFDLTGNLRENEALIEDSFCDPSHRGKRYHSKMILFCLCEIVKQKKEKALVIILKENRPALRAMKKSDFSIVNFFL